MGNLEALSSHSIYTQNESVYFPDKVKPLLDKQEDSDEKKSNNPLTGEINDEAIISDEARNLLAQEEASKEAQETYTYGNSSDEQETEAEETTGTIAEEDSEEPQKAQNEEELSPEEKQAITELKTRDAKVKAHEQAHRAAAAGINASAPNYDYEVGPDGNKYAVAGEVNISFTQSSDPAENLTNAQTMKRAALAPADPSSTDRAVARHADQLIAEAKEQTLQEKQAEMKEKTVNEYSKTKEPEKTGTNPAVDTENNENTITSKTDELPTANYI